MDRTCGDCSVCCFIGGVPELEKSAYTSCSYECNGCSIFGKPERPAVCNSFQCSWLKGYGLPDDRPDINGVMCSTNKLNGGVWVFAIESKPNSVLTTGRKMVERMAILAPVPVIVVDYGVQPPNNKGNRVVIKDSLKNRSKFIMGTFLDFLDEEKTIGIYGLVIR